MLPRKTLTDGCQAIDWAEAEKMVRELTSQEIYAQIQDCLGTLSSADELDREVPLRQSRGGFYRDELSVYRRELSRRLEMNVCPTCLK